MESFNKVLYFILGLVVVLVFIIVFTGRLNLGKTFRPLAGTTPTPTPKVTDQKGFLSFFGAGKATPTPTPKAGATPTPTVQMNQQAGNQQMTSKGGTVTKVQPSRQPDLRRISFSLLFLLFFRASHFAEKNNILYVILGNEMTPESILDKPE